MKLFNKHISHVPYTDRVRIFRLFLFFFFCCFGFEYLKELGLYIYLSIVIGGRWWWFGGGGGGVCVGGGG